MSNDQHASCSSLQQVIEIKEHWGQVNSNNKKQTNKQKKTKTKQKTKKNKNKTKQNKAKQNKTKQNKTKQNKTKQKQNKTKTWWPMFRVDNRLLFRKENNNNKICKTQSHKIQTVVANARAKHKYISTQKEQICYCLKF